MKPSFLFDVTDPISEAIEWYEEAVLLAELRRSRILDSLSLLPHKYKLPKAIELYWFYRDLFATTELASVIGVEKRDFQAACKENSMLVIEERCERCQAVLRRKAKSRTDYQQSQDWVKRYGQPLCEKCKKKDAEEHDRQSRERQASWQAELQSLREMPYSEYLKTNHWRALRIEKLKRAKFRCELCSDNFRLQVHHKTYERRGCEWLSDLTVLCEDCHAKFHDKLPETN